MSRGALLQLIAKGEADNYLYDNTNLDNSLFNNSINRITNFSEAPYSFYSNSSNPSWGENLIFKIDNIGDLLKNMYLVLKLPAISVEDIVEDLGGTPDNDPQTSSFRVKWLDYIGNVIIEKITLKIGGQIIDQQTGEYIQFQTDIYDATWSKYCMLGHEDSLILPQTKIDSQFLYIPLKFFFCDSISKALPVVAMEYHPIEIEVKLRDWNKLYLVLKEINSYVDSSTTEVSKVNYIHTSNTLTKKNLTNLRLDCNFIFLDKNERVEISKKKHEILITQVQSLEVPIIDNKTIFLNFNHPIKDMFFCIQNLDIINLGEIFNFSGKSQFIPINDSDNNAISEISDNLWNQIPRKHLLDEASLLFNNNELVPNKDFRFWHYLQNYEHYRTTLLNNIYMYSFGLTPALNTGSCNFSMIDKVQLNVTLSKTTKEFIHKSNTNKVNVGPSSTNVFKIFANNYNILVIENGLAGLMFSK